MGLNKNLKVVRMESYKGSDLYPREYVVKYVARVYDTLERASNSFGNAFAVRFELNFPLDVDVSALDCGSIIKTFINSLKSQIKASCSKSNRGRNIDSTVRYIWCKELNRSHREHYHFLLIVNHYAYRTLGVLGSDKNNLSNRIQKAWSRALSKALKSNDFKSNVHFSKNGSYKLKRGNKEQFDLLFYRTAYLAKSDTKSHGNRKNIFQCSRL